jgi:uncharacterized RDD family membrane protein YckC
MSDDTSHQPSPNDPHPPLKPVPGVGQPADLSSRFLARLIDYVLLFVVDVVIGSVVVLGAIMGYGPGDFVVGTTQTYLAGVVSTVISVAIYLGYFTAMETFTGQTVGKMLLRLETRGPDGGRPTWEQALRRNLFTAIWILGLVPGVGGLLAWLGSLVAVITIAVTISNNPATRQGWHDDFAGGTRVIRVG